MKGIVNAFETLMMSSGGTQEKTPQKRVRRLGLLCLQLILLY